MPTPSKLLKGFSRIAGSGRAERFEKDGISYSRRQYDKLRRESQMGERLSNEEFAKFNRAIAEDKALARPARNRKSLRKLDAESQKRAIAQIKESERLKRELKDLEREKAQIHRNIERAKSRKIKRKKISGSILKAGHMAANVEFGSGNPEDEDTSDYEEYLEAYKEAKSTRKIFAYSLGINGVHSETGRPVTITVFRMDAFGKPISEETFFDRMNAAIEGKMYFVGTNYYMHLAFNKDYALRPEAVARAKARKTKRLNK